MIPTVVWIVFLFSLGACVGSFLNVVVYRLPRGLSLVSPGSRCGSCAGPIRWYDNIPIFSWFILRGRCRKCGAGFSIRYALVELLTALLFVGFYWVYFVARLRGGMPEFEEGGYLVYGGHMILVSVLLASSLIDAERMYFELSVIHFGALIAVVLAGIWPYAAAASCTDLTAVMPQVGPKAAAWALGSAFGLVVSLLLVRVGLIRRSYAEFDEALEEAEKAGREEIDIEVNHRGQMVRELAFLGPVVLGGWVAGALLAGNGPAAVWWVGVIGGQKWAAGLLGGVFGFMIGGGVVWATRILGTLGFGREAMGMGDVHLMAAVGAMLGWISPTLAFFVAPFFGLGWAIVRWVFHGTREIPYGPFLSMGTLVVMVMQDPMVRYFAGAILPPS